MIVTGGHASVRRARLEDAEAIAAVHVVAWQESYTGLVPAEMLASLSVQERAGRWRRILGEPGPAIATVAFVACVPGGAVAGFSSCGQQRSAELARAGFGGEFQAIYVLRAAQRRGVGRALMGAMARDLADRGLQGGALWRATSPPWASTICLAVWSLRNERTNGARTSSLPRLPTAGRVWPRSRRLPPDASCTGCTALARTTTAKWLDGAEGPVARKRTVATCMECHGRGWSSQRITGSSLPTGEMER